MELVIHRAEERGVADHGWLSSRFSFSFAGWYDPSRMGYGALRVLNDDRIAPGTGFGTHEHSDMEIITLVMKGAVMHKDSLGTLTVVPAGDVQVMSAGTGVAHSEVNASPSETLELFQLWIQPCVKGGEPAYDQASFLSHAEGSVLLVSPDGREGSLSIRQDSFITRVALKSGESFEYLHYDVLHGTYVFVIDGSVTVNNELLATRDAIAIPADMPVGVVASSDALLLLIEIPLI